jgi:hypothetical protein
LPGVCDIKFFHYSARVRTSDKRQLAYAIKAIPGNFKHAVENLQVAMKIGTIATINEDFVHRRIVRNIPVGQTPQEQLQSPTFVFVIDDEAQFGGTVNEIPLYLHAAGLRRDGKSEMVARHLYSIESGILILYVFPKIVAK